MNIHRKSYDFLQLALLICLLALSESSFAKMQPLLGISAGSVAIEPGPVGCVGESGTNVGTFTIGVSLAPTNPITVYLSRSGTADGPPFPLTGCAVPIDGDYTVDYYVGEGCSENPPESVVIPAGTNFVTVNIIPLFNNDVTPEKTVIMSVVSFFPSNSPNGLPYILAASASSATNYIQKVDTYGAGFDDTPQSVTAGGTTTLALQRTASCDFGTSLYSTPDSVVYYLIGDASYGSDYVVNPTPDVGVITSSRPIALYCTIGISNSIINIPITTYNTCAFGNKIIGLVSSCDYVTGSTNCYYGPNRWATNSTGCLYFEGIHDYITITHATNQPTLDTATYSNSVFRFNINGQTGAPYSILASSNLSDWVNVASFVMTSCTMQASDNLNDGFPLRFYRIVIGSGGPTSSAEFTFREAEQSPQVNQVMAGNAMQSIGAATTASETAVEQDPLTTEEQYILIEAQRLKWEDEGNPAAAILPPTPLTAGALPSKAGQLKK